MRKRKEEKKERDRRRDKGMERRNNNIATKKAVLDCVTAYDLIRDNLHRGKLNTLLLTT